MASSLKDKTVKGVFWSAIDRFSTQGIQFVFGILIARLLLPSDYGVIAMLGIFMAVAQTFIDSGFGTALIRKLNRTQTDYSTVFYFNIAVSVIAYIGLWFASPYIADFYNIPLLESVTKVVGLNLIVSAFSGIQNSILSINIDFKSRAKISIFTTIVTGIVGLWMAYNGYGVWALVFQALSGSILRTVLMWYFVKWHPTLAFSWKSFKELFCFGSKMLASGLLDTIYNNIYTLVIGKCFSSSSLGVYSRASGLVEYPSSNITGVLQSVTFPVLSTIQNDEKRLGDSYRRVLKISVFIIFPLMVGLAAVADPFIRVVLTDKWEGTIYLMQILCFSLMWYPVHAINLNLLMVKGRSDYFLKLEILKKILGVLVLCVTVPLGLVAMCYGRAFTAYISLGLNTYYTNKLIGYGFVKQMKDLFPFLIQSLLMGALVSFVVSIMTSPWLQLLVGIIVGMLYYLISSYIFKLQELRDLIEIIKRKK